MKQAFAVCGVEAGDRRELIANSRSQDQVISRDAATCCS
jgi:hypothetical protein